MTRAFRLAFSSWFFVEQENCKQKAVNFKCKQRYRDHIPFFSAIKILIFNNSKTKMLTFESSNSPSLVYLLSQSSFLSKFVFYVDREIDDHVSRRKNPLNREALNIFIFYRNWTGFFFHRLGYSRELFSLSREYNTEISVFFVKWQQVC